MRLKKFLSAALSAAMLISCVSFGGGTVVQAAGEMNIARNLQISAYSGTEGDFPVSSVNDGRGDDTQNDNYRWFSKEALKGSGARGNAAYLIFDLGENGPRSFSGIDIRFHNMEEIKSISMQNVTFSYKGKKRYVFEDFSVDIEPNHITGIIGRNGQGKTTLMNLIAGKFEPDEGIIEIDGKNPATDIGTAKRIIYVAGVMSYSEIKLKKIIEEYRLMYEKFDEEFAHKLMELFGLNKKAKIKNLSKGQETIFNFCCGMATRADITILDEPVSGVDAVSRNKIYEIILRDYIEHPRTILISSHMLGEMEKILSHMIMIGNNDVLFAGDIEELKDSVYRVDGELANIEKYCEEKKVLYKKNQTLGAMAVIEGRLNKEEAEKADELELATSKLSGEEIYMYKTDLKNANQMEALWEKKN